jgi:hypothetical protein
MREEHSWDVVANRLAAVYEALRSG